MNATKKLVSSAFILLAGAGLTVALLSIYGYSSYKSGIVEPLREDLIRRTRDASSRIDGSLEPARQAADELARELTGRGEASESELVRLLRATITRDDSIYGSAIAYQPGSELPYAFLAAVYAEMDRMDEARKAAGKVIRLNPNFSAVRFMKSHTLHDSARDARFVELLRRAGLPE